MSSVLEALQPFVEWCDTPPPTDLRQAHILRAILTPNDDHPDGPILARSYLGTFVFARRQGRPQFQGTALAGIDWSESISSDLLCIKMQLDLFPADTVAATFTVCILSHLGAVPPLHASHGRVFHPFEATEVQPVEERVFFLMVEGRQ